MPWGGALRPAAAPIRAIAIALSLALAGAAAPGELPPPGGLPPPGAGWSVPGQTLDYSPPPVFRKPDQVPDDFGRREIPPLAEWWTPRYAPGDAYPAPGRAGSWKPAQVTIPEEVREVGPPPEFPPLPHVGRMLPGTAVAASQVAFGTAGLDYFWVRIELVCGPGFEPEAVEFAPGPHTRILEGRRGARLAEEVLPVRRVAGEPFVLLRPVYTTESIRVRVRARVSQGRGREPFLEEADLGAEFRYPEAPEGPALAFRVETEAKPAVWTGPGAQRLGTVRYSWEPDLSDPDWGRVREVRYDQSGIGAFSPQTGQRSPRRRGNDLTQLGRLGTCRGSVNTSPSSAQIDPPHRGIAAFVRWEDGSVTNRAVPLPTLKEILAPAGPEEDGPPRLRSWTRE